MKTEKKWIKLSLTNAEKENLENHANLNNITLSKMINKLILSLEQAPVNDKNLEAGEITTAFNVDKNLVEILEEYSKKYNISKNKILRNLITDLKVIESQNKEDNNEEAITTRIDKDSISELKELAKKKNINVSLMVRQVFSNLDLIEIKDREFELDSKLTINVSSNFKKSFSEKSKQLEISNSELLRNIIYAILAK